MKKHSRGFIPLIPLLIIAVAVAVSGGVYMYSDKATDTHVATNESVTVETKTSAEQSTEIKKQNEPTTPPKTDKATIKTEVETQAELTVPVGTATQITSITPAKATIGTTITLKGSGFSTTQNSIHYRRIDDTKTRFIAFRPSTDGKTITFVLPSRESFSPTASCTDPSKCIEEPITPGTYLISVGKYFQVTAEESNYVLLTVE